MLLVALHTVQAVWQPVRESEVDRFVEVELMTRIHQCCKPHYGLVGIQQTYPMVEPGVVRLGKRYHELARSLVARVNFHACFFDPLGIHEGNQLEEQVGLSLE